MATAGRLLLRRFDFGPARLGGVGDGLATGGTHSTALGRLGPRRGSRRASQLLELSLQSFNLLFERDDALQFRR